MVKKMKLGVIGCGGMATNIHVPSIMEIENCKIVAVCDLYEEKAKALASKYNIPKTYALQHEMIEKEMRSFLVIIRCYGVLQKCIGGCAVLAVSGGKHRVFKYPLSLGRIIIRQNYSKNEHSAKKEHTRYQNGL